MKFMRTCDRLLKLVSIFGPSLLVFAISFNTRPAEALDKYCLSPDISEMSVTGHPYKVRYQTVKGTREDLPTLIYLQGGPAGNGINPTSTRAQAWTELRMDMPGTGCSKMFAGVSPNAVDLSTDNFVRLWVQLIHKLKLKKVVLLGRSYGTQVATQLASRLESDGSVKVNSVILEGTTGPAGSFPQWAAGYFAGWEQLRKDFSSRFSDAELVAQEPFGIPADDFAKFVIYAQTLSYSPDPKGNMKLVHPMDLLETLKDPASSRASKQNVHQTLHQISLKLSGFISIYLYQRLSCEESNPSGFEYNLIWQNGHLDYPAHGFCEGKPWKLQRPYDPKNYSYRAPTIYIEGGQDPNTPLGGKLYHIDVETASPRKLVVAERGGHGILEGGMFDSCKSDVVLDILEHGTVDAKSYAKCNIAGVSEYDFKIG